MEAVIKGMITRRIQNKSLLLSESEDGRILHLTDGRTVAYASEPDLAFYDEAHTLLIAVEIKGGIDPAGVLERIGVVIKSLHRAKRENEDATTILLIPNISMTEQGKQELVIHGDDIDHWFTSEDVLNREDVKQALFEMLDI
jgi:hypothetical protein